MPETSGDAPALKTAEICAAVGAQVMDCLNETGAPVAIMGHSLPDGSYEFLLGPVYLPNGKVSLAAPTETRRLFTNLRLEDARLAEPRRVRWMCKRGDEYAEIAQPARAIVIERTEVPPDENVVIIYHHNSAR